MINSLDKRNLFVVGAVFSLMGVVAFILIQSPERAKDALYPGIDSSVYQLIASMLLQGDMPYRDIFDHKGPWLYLIDAFGFVLNGAHGILLLEFSFLFGTVAIWYITLRKLGVLPSFSLFACLICTFAVGAVLDGGNVPEEYILIFVSYAVYAYAKYFVDGRIRRTELFLAGFSSTAILMLKFTAILAQMPFIVGIFILSLKQGEALRNTLLFFAGLLVPLLLTIGWLAVNDALVPFIKDYVLYNVRYAGHAALLDRLGSIMHFAAVSLFVVSIVMMAAMLYLKVNFSFVVCNLCALILVFGVNATTGYSFSHYAIVFTPFYVVPVGWAMCYLQSLSPKIKPIAYSLCAIWAVASAVLPDAQATLDSAKASISTTEMRQPVVSCVDELHLAEGARIAVVGNACWIYLESGTLPSSVYAYLPAYIQDTTPWFDAIRQSLIDSNVPVLIVQESKFPSFVEESGLGQEYIYKESVSDFAVYVKE